MVIRGGADFDGVICYKFLAHWFFHPVSQFKVFDPFIRFIMERCQPNYDLLKLIDRFWPGFQNFFIISGRKERFLETSRQWLLDQIFPLSPPDLENFKFRPPDLSSLQHKVKQIKELGLPVFIEDEERIATLLQKEIPSCRIISPNPLSQLENFLRDLTGTVLFI